MLGGGDGGVRLSAANSVVRQALVAQVRAFSAQAVQSVYMAISRADRRGDREGRARAEFGPHAAAVLDVLELTEFAWHDCYGEVTPPDAVIEDIFVVARGSVTGFVRAARLAVEDFRDLRLAANSVRS